MSLSGRGLRVDVTLEKLDDRVPKVQDGSGDASANLSGKRTETMNCPAAVQERTAAREFFLALCDGPRSLLPGPFFVPKERENTMLESLEATLYPIVVNINNYLSSYILVFLLIAVGLWYSIRTRFVQVRCFGEGMRKVFGNLTLRGKKHASGMSSFQALATAIAAQVGGDPCCAYIGPEGAGHYVKMVHNGIEYGDMQLICEAYYLMKRLLHLSPDEIADYFRRWNLGELSSYLMEISAHILTVPDPETGAPLVDQILGEAGSKGTGMWTVQEALSLGVPLPTIAQAVFARDLSCRAQVRAAMSRQAAPHELRPGPGRLCGKDPPRSICLQALLLCTRL